MDSFYNGLKSATWILPHAFTCIPIFLGDGPFPGVIDMFGSSGGIYEFRSALMASRGIASLSLPYFRYEDLPDTILDVDFEYFLVRFW